MREKYNPRPNAAELRWHKWLLERLCVCCGRRATVVHHVLQDWPEKRWRRDHWVTVPLTMGCHNSLHARGDEKAWADERGIDLYDEWCWLKEEYDGA